VCTWNPGEPRRAPPRGRTPGGRAGARGETVRHDGSCQIQQARPPAYNAPKPELPRRPVSDFSCPRSLAVRVHLEAAGRCPLVRRNEARRLQTLRRAQPGLTGFPERASRGFAANVRTATMAVLTQAAGPPAAIEARPGSGPRPRTHDRNRAGVSPLQRRRTVPAVVHEDHGTGPRLASPPGLGTA